MSKTPLKHGSLFSGVGGLDLGFDAAGIHTLWQCEINKQARSVLARHWPKAKRYEDVTTVSGYEAAPVDIISFGSPCQDLSEAGKRAGFQDGTRSNLYFEAIRIIREMREQTNGEYPRYAVWENVRGALNSNGGADFTAALQALADIGALDISWRVVTTNQFGPPQRRLRLFVVADFGGETAAQILAQPPRVCWHPRKSAEAGTETTGGTEKSSGVSGWQSAVDTARALTIHIGSGVDDNFAQAGHLVYTKGRPAPTLNVSDNTGDTRATVLAVTLEEDYRVRRLTPRECERLQGWPDDHTRWADDGKEISDSARYKMAGNGISAPVAQWLGENIIAAQNQQP